MTNHRDTFYGDRAHPADEPDMTLPDGTSGAVVLADALTRAADPTVLEDGKVYGFPTTDGGVQVVDRDLDQYRSKPRRKTGSVNLHTPDALLAYIDKHKIVTTEVYADLYGTKFTAILNGHDAAASADEEGDAGWRDHRAVYDLRHTDEWTDWASKSDQWMDQGDFAEFIEDHLSDISIPDAATVLEVALSIQASTSVKFESSKRLDNGQATFEYREDINGTAGERGSLSIPTELVLVIRPFEGGAHYEQKVRFRYRVAGGQLRLSFKLLEPDRVIRHAFDGIVDTIRVGFEGPVFDGAAPTA